MEAAYHERLEFALGRRMPLRTDTASGECPTSTDDGLPLHGLPANDRQRFFFKRRDPKRWILNTERSTDHRRFARCDPPLLLPALYELDVYSPGRNRRVCQPSSDDARRCVMVQAFHRNLDEGKAAMGDDLCGS